MIDIIQVNILKLINKFFNTKKLSRKINLFYVNKAIKTKKNIQSIKKKIFLQSK